MVRGNFLWQKASKYIHYHKLWKTLSKGQYDCLSFRCILGWFSIRFTIFVTWVMPFIILINFWLNRNLPHQYVPHQLMDDLSNLCHREHSVDNGIGVGLAKDPLMLKLAYSVSRKTIICIAVYVRVFLPVFPGFI